MSQSVSIDPYSAPKPSRNQPFPLQRRGQSGFGITSLVIAVTAGLLIVGTIGWGSYVELTTMGGLDENSTEAIIVGLVIFIGLAVALVGIAFGLVSCLQQTKGKVIGIIGLVFNVLIIAGVMLLLML